MTDLRQAARQALEAMEYSGMDVGKFNRINAACRALKAALAEPVQPVAWEQFHEHMGGPFYRAPPQPAEPVQEPGQRPVAWLLQSELDELLACNHMGLGADSPTIWAPYDISTPSADMGLVPVYAAPPQRPAEPVQEPVAGNWSVFNTGAEVFSGMSLPEAVAELTPARLERGWSAVCVINKDNPPTHAPPQRKPLTKEEIDSIWDSEKVFADIYAIARAVEAAHGIKEGT